MNQNVGDEAAIAFAQALYRALASGTCVQDAFDLGVNQLELLKIPEEHIPTLLAKEGVIPADVVPVNPI